MHSPASSVKKAGMYKSGGVYIATSSVTARVGRHAVVIDSPI